MKTKKFQLVLNVEIDPQGETTEHLIRQLNRVVSNAVNEGLLTGNTAATVEKYSYDVKQVTQEEKTNWLIVNDHDANDTFEVEATSKTVADEALRELGWWVAKQD